MFLIEAQGSLFYSMCLIFSNNGTKSMKYGEKVSSQNLMEKAIVFICKVKKREHNQNRGCIQTIIMAHFKN